MSHWAYSKCTDCGSSVHIGAFCYCGNDPHRVLDNRKAVLSEKEKVLEDLKTQVAIAQKEFEEEKENYIRCDQQQRDYRNNFLVKKLQNSLK